MQSTSLISQTTDETLLKYFAESNTLTELYCKIGYKNIKCIKKRHNIELEKRLNNLGLSTVHFRANKNKEKKTCLNCGCPVHNLFCSRKCQKEYNDKQLIENWKLTGDTRCKTQTTIRNAIRDYIYSKQNSKCAICGIENSWNGKKLNFILDHIDGDASNNFEDNLRLICPNCDSQLDTYKSKNKNSARSHRKI